MACGAPPTYGHRLRIRREQFRSDRSATCTRQPARSHLHFIRTIRNHRVIISSDLTIEKNPARVQT